MIDTANPQLNNPQLIRPEPLIDWDQFQETRRLLGPGLVRVLGYFAADGAESIKRIETAMRAGDAAGLVAPAHKLKGEARQFGAERLAAVAEELEAHARACVELRAAPDDAMLHAVALRPLFEEAMARLERETNPLVTRQRGGGFGRAR